MSGHDRGVSDVLAFVLIFAVVIASVGLIGAVGFETVASVSDGEQLRSAELSMAEVADQLTGIADHEAPVRSSELRVGGGTIAVTDGITLTIHVHGDALTDWNRTYDLGAIEYRYGETSIMVVGGSIVRVDDDHGYLLEAPPWLVSDDRARINLLSVQTHRGPSAITTNDLVQVQSHHQGTQLLEPANRSHLYDVESIEIEISGEDAIVDAWTQYLDRDERWSATSDGWISPADGETGFTGGVIIRHSRIGIQFIQ